MLFLSSSTTSSQIKITSTTQPPPRSSTQANPLLQDKMKFSLLTVALAALATASPMPENEQHEKRILGLFKPKPGVPFTFTSTWEVKATPGQVVNTENKYTGGLANSWGLFKFGINSQEDIICYNITLYGFRGEYQSPAKTATHIHEAAKGMSGPPR